jgi:hypothetical protein
MWLSGKILNWFVKRYMNNVPTWMNGLPSVGGSWGNIPKKRLPWPQNLMSPLYGNPMRSEKKRNSSNNSSMPPFGMPLGDMMNQWPFNQKNFDPFWVFRQSDGQGKGNSVKPLTASL